MKQVNKEHRAEERRAAVWAGTEQTEARATELRVFSIRTVQWNKDIYFDLKYI